MQVSLEPFGKVAYTLPAILLILMSRELFRNYLFVTFESKRSEFAAYYLDALAVVSMSLWGIGWGGINHRERQDTLLTFLLSQLYFVLFGFLIIVYYHLHRPEPTAYVYQFVQHLVRQAYCLFIVNLIPIPPFDASFFYVQKGLKEQQFQVMMVITKLAIIVVLVFDVLHLDILKADFVVRIFLK